MKDCEVVVEFGRGVPPDLQGVALLQMERSLREAGCPAEVYKATKGDDSKVRLNLMDQEKRAKL